MQIGLLLLFIGLPLLELALLIKLGQTLGVWRTLAIIIGTGMLGAWVLSSQGMMSLERLRRAAEAGQSPGGAMTDGLIRSFAGVLLLLPGVVMDIAGLALLFPPLRRLIANWMARRTTAHVSIDIRTERGPFRSDRDGPAAHPPRDPGVIEGEFERIDERPSPGRRPGPPKT